MAKMGNKNKQMGDIPSLLEFRFEYGEAYYEIVCESGSAPFLNGCFSPSHRVSG